MVAAKKRNGVSKDGFCAMVSTEITRKEYSPEYIRENDQRFQRGGAIALRNRIEIRPIVLPVCQLFRFTRYVVSRPLLYRVYS